MHPDTGTGGELYAIIGHATRQLDRNIAIVGRVVSGIEHLAALPRGTETMGFYKEGLVAKPIVGMTLASALPAAQRPSFQYLDTATPAFARYLHVRKNRNDDFYRVAAGGVDLCNVQVPVRPTPGRRTKGLGSPGVGAALVAMADHRGAGVRAHARFGERQRSRAEGAFGRHPPDQPMRAATAGAMIDLMLAVHRVITATSGVMRHAQVAEGRDIGHKSSFRRH